MYTIGKCLGHTDITGGVAGMPISSEDSRPLSTLSMRRPANGKKIVSECDEYKLAWKVSKIH